MPVLVTGATGLAGSAVVAALLERGESVRILRRESSPTSLLGSFSDHVEHVYGDITDPDAVEKAMRGVRKVYHVAGRIGFGGRSEREKLFRVNVEGTRNVVEAALHAGVERMVHTSSIAALGRMDGVVRVLDESTEWEESPANTPYGRSKHLAELEVHRGIAEGLDAVLVNPSLIFGIGRSGENTMAVVEKVRDRRLPGIPSGGNGVVDVLDVAESHLLAMEKGRSGERYILSSQNLLWSDIIRILADAFGVQPPRWPIPRPIGMALAVATELSAAAFRFRPLITRETVAQASRVDRYNNEKAVGELGCRFRTFEETALRLASVLARRSDP